MHVLLVEDDALVGEILGAVLHDFGHEVVWAHDANSAIAAMASGPPPELLLTDFDLGNVLTGIDVAETFVDRFPNSAVVIVSGRPDEARVKITSKCHARFLPKPFAAQDLQIAITDALGLARAA